MKHTHIRHLAAIAVAAQLAMSASAAPIDNYTDLADAVANAATGDTIKLKAGTINVTSTITITKGITLSGGWTDDSTRADGAVTVLDGGDLTTCEQVVSVRALSSEGSVTLDSLCLTRGYRHGLYEANSSHWPQDACDLIITNCQFVANGSTQKGYNGTGACMDGGSSRPVVTIKDSLFAGNIIFISEVAEPRGGGLYAKQLSSLVIENCDFITNGVPFSVSVKNWNENPCRNGFHGAAIYSDGVPTSISGCRFLGNFAREGSTVGFSGACGGSSISNCLFAANQHNVIAAGWNHTTFGTINVNMSTLADTLSISGCTIAYNASGSKLAAAGLSVITGTVDVRDSIIFGNCVGTDSTVGSDIMTGNNGTVNLAYSLVTGSSGAYMSGSVVAGTGVIYGDPLFVTDDATVSSKITSKTSMAYYDPTKTTQEETIGFDLHLRSKVGYFLNDGTLVENGTESSLAIDAADPASDFSREGDPNGGRRNMGFYGNKAEASRSRLASAEIESVTISFPNGYSKPDVTVTLADSEDAYTAEIVLYSGIEGTMPNGWTWTNYVHGAAQGSTSVLSPGEYLTAGDTYSIRVEAYVIGTAAVAAQSTAVVTGTIPPWVGHGGGATVVHVREGADAKMDGSDWANAFPDIKSALMAVTADKTEMWIAGNIIYDSTPGTLHLAGPLTIRGGFTGLEDTAAARPAGSSATLDGAGSFDLLSIGNGAGFDLVVERILFTRATSWGVSKSDAGDATFRDCRFLDNGGWAKYYTGGALKLTGAGAVVTVTNCLFDGNLSSREYASYQQNVAAIGSALSATSLGRLVLVDTSFVTNGIAIADGAVDPYGPVSGTGPDGVVLKADASPVVARNCRFVGNTGHAWQTGGIVSLVGASGGSAFTNCLFAGNQTPCSMRRSANNGATKYIHYSGTVSVRLSNAAQTVDFSQCTIAYNLGDSLFGGGGLEVHGGTANVVNSILFGNQRGPEATGGADICVRTNAVLNLSYSLVTADDASRISCDEGGTNTTEGVLYGDPLFMTDRATYEGWTVTSTTAFGSFIYNVASNATDLCAINAHLRSKTGYTDETTGELVRTPSVMSPAIDAGREGTPYADEPSPNGRRANLGFYGNTPYASRSESSGFILVVR